MIKKLSLQAFNNHENELTESFRNKNRGTTNGLINNAFQKTIGNSVQNRPGSCQLLVQKGFEGNPLTPFYLPPVGYYASECNIAISNAGKIVSISNVWIRYYNENGTLTFSDSLYHFGNSLIDVHVMHDPKKDRFIFISGYGITNFINIFQGLGIVTAFSKTNDPIDGWNFYYLPDADFNDNAIGDYPQLGISDNEIFITEIRTNNGGKILADAKFEKGKYKFQWNTAGISAGIYFLQPKLRNRD